MAEPIRPAGVQTFGKTNWIYVPVIADTDAPTVAEITSASGLDVTNMLYGEQFTGVSAESSRVSSPPRLGDTESYESFGRTTYGMGDLVYSFDPQSATAADGRKAFEALPEGTTGYLVKRVGISKATAPAAGQKVSIYPVAFGAQLEIEVGDGEAAESAIQQPVTVTNAPTLNVEIAA